MTLASVWLIIPKCYTLSPLLTACLKIICFKNPFLTLEQQKVRVGRYFNLEMATTFWSISIISHDTFIDLRSLVPDDLKVLASTTRKKYATQLVFLLELASQVEAARVRSKKKTYSRVLKPITLTHYAKITHQANADKNRDRSIWINISWFKKLVSAQP